MQTQHATVTFTPVARPWRAMPMSGDESDPRWAIAGMTGSFDMVAVTAMGHDEQHARFIVKAANHHDELRSFVQRFLEFDEGRLLFGPLFHEQARELLDAVDK